MPIFGFNASPSPRHTLMSLGGTVLAVIAINGLIAVFGLYFSNDENLRALGELDRVVEDLNAARDAEVHFKVQVQEWKNILLRGDSPEDYAHYRSAFEREQQSVRDRLKALDSSQPPIADRARALLREHEDLGRLYAEALAGHPEPLGDPRELDAQVRGIDRPLTKSLESLSDDIGAQFYATKAAVRSDDIRRYETLRLVMISTSAVGAGLVLILLLVAMRNAERR